MIKQKTKQSFIMFFIALFTFASFLPMVSVFQEDYKVDAFTMESLDVTDGNVVIPGFDADNSDAAWKVVIDKYKQFIVGIGSIATVTFIVFFILNITKVAASATNPMARGQAIVGVVWTGIAAALLGSVTIWFGFFYNSLKGVA